MIRVPVPLGEGPVGRRGDEVLVGRGVAGHVAELLPPGCRRVAIVTQAGVPSAVPVAISGHVDRPVTTIAVEDGERAKSLATVEKICRSLAGFGLTREDTLVGVGGGVVTDLAGFAASAYHRGVAVVHVPTTLLGQVDAAIGGKTGVNLPEGKNLVGAFWQPAGVCCDVALLDTLPEREWRSGKGEMVKYAFLGIGDLTSLPLEEQVARCVALKASVVAADELEGGRRMILNYGHTLAHALEAAGFADTESASLRHGEAVAIGLVFAARLARRLGRIEPDRVDEHILTVVGEGLPTRLPAGCDLGELIELMRRDKKATDGLTFVLEGQHGVGPVQGVQPEDVRAALEEMEVI